MWLHGCAETVEKGLRFVGGCLLSIYVGSTVWAK